LGGCGCELLPKLLHVRSRTVDCRLYCVLLLAIDESNLAAGFNY